MSELLGSPLPRLLVNSAVTCLPVTNARLQRARDRIRDRRSTCRVESNPVGINPTQLATLVALSSCLYPTPEIAEAESKALDKESALDSGSAVTCLPVTSTFVENLSNVCCA